MYLGITAVDAGEVLDIMFTDFPSKYEEYRQHLRETRDTRASNKPPAHLATERSKQVYVKQFLLILNDFYFSCFNSNIKSMLLQLGNFGKGSRISFFVEC